MKVAVHICETSVKFFRLHSGISQKAVILKCYYLKSEVFTAVKHPEDWDSRFVLNVYNHRYTRYDPVWCVVYACRVLSKTSQSRSSEMVCSEALQSTPILLKIVSFYLYPVLLFISSRFCWTITRVGREAERTSDRAMLWKWLDLRLKTISTLTERGSCDGSP
jgi:hypothetical protein